MDTLASKTGRRWLLDALAGGLLILALAAVYVYEGRMAEPTPDKVAQTSSLFNTNIRLMPRADADLPTADSAPSPAPDQNTLAPKPSPAADQNTLAPKPSPAADQNTLAPKPSPAAVQPAPPATGEESGQKPEARDFLGSFVITAVPEPPKPVVTANVVEALLNSTQLNKFGNPEGEGVGLASKNEFSGARILMWSAEPQVHALVFTDDNPLWAALRDKGFEIRVERNRFEPRWLDDTDQLWIFAGQASGMDTQAEKAIVAFVEDGKGMYMAADNEPFLVEVTRLAQRLYHTQISGNFQGTNLIAVRGHGVTREDYQKSQSGKNSDQRANKFGERIDVIRRATHYAEEHPLLTDVNFIYEGITISHITSTPALQTVLQASDGQILAAVAADRSQRVIVDCGFTRYGYSSTERYVTQTAGTLRYAENIAAYLMGKDDKGSKWTNWRDRRELMVKYRTSSQQEILALLKDSNPDKRWAAAAAAGRRKLEIPEPLIELLRDDDGDIRQQARAALRQLADGRDYGPLANASAKNREIAYQNWRGWLSRFQLVVKYGTLGESEVVAAMADLEPVHRWAAVNSAKRRRLEVPDALIRCLLDPVLEIRAEAHTALVQISGGADFGPASEAQGAAREAAVVEWRRFRLPKRFPALAHIAEPELVRFLQSKDDDERWAAVVAVRQRKLQPFDLLVQLLADRETVIQQDARQALVQLSKQDFGPYRGASSQEIVAAQGQWTAWWKDKSEKIADGKLKIAKLLLKQDLAKARRRLQEIIAAQPGTRAADEAKELLDQNP